LQIQSYLNINLNTKTNFYFGLVAVNILALGFTFGFLNPGDIDTDGGTFAAIAMKDMNGGTLYLDTWDHKPPGIYYLIELFFTFIGNKIGALYFLAVLGVLAMVSGLYFTIQFLLESFLLSILLSALFILITVNSFFLGDGLYTEMFGIIFIIWSLCFYHLYEKGQKVYHAFLAASFAGFAFWFKEPFIFLSIPVIIFLAVNLKKWNKIGMMSIFFMLPTMLFLILLWLNGSLAVFFDMILYNVNYTNNKDNIVSNEEQLKTLWNNILNPLFLLTALIIIWGLRSIPHLKTNKQLFLNISMLAGGLFFILLSPYNFNHYYLPFIIIFFYCIAAFLYLEKLHYKGSRIYLYIILLYTINSLDGSKSSSFKTFYKTYQPDRISERLLKEKSKTLFVDLVGASAYYVKGDKIFPTYLAVPVHYHFNESRQGLINRKRIYNELKNNKPGLLITNETTSYMYWQIPDPSFYTANYKKIDSMNTNNGQRVFLWRLR
jgi:hypothetical protein